ncbi:MAG: DUF4292 domain-containing protein, partial [Chlorobiaceae bacterium]|nr:DUF4292 domain-containing protein [Chlorobiaceae bacterium]
DMLNNRLILGSNNERNIEKMLGVNSGYRMLTESILGLVRITEPESSIRSVSKGPGKLLFTLGTPPGSKELLVDPSNKTLTALFLKDLKGNTVTEVHFRDFVSCAVGDKSVLAPKKIEMVMFRDGNEADGERQLVISYDERVLKQDTLSLKFTVPEKARVVNLDDIEGFHWK